MIYEACSHRNPTNKGYKANQDNDLKITRMKNVDIEQVTHCHYENYLGSLSHHFLKWGLECVMELPFVRGCNFVVVWGINSGTLGPDFDQDN
jgi:hypothetical protein